jgi:hypothetical protein
MITLTLYLYFSMTGEVQWDSEKAKWLGLFDLLALTMLSDISLVSIDKT